MGHSNQKLGNILTREPNNQRTQAFIYLKPRGSEKLKIQEIENSRIKNLKNLKIGEFKNPRTETLDNKELNGPVTEELENILVKLSGF